MAGCPQPWCSGLSREGGNEQAAVTPRPYQPLDVATIRLASEGRQPSSVGLSRFPAPTTKSGRTGQVILENVYSLKALLHSPDGPINGMASTPPPMQEFFNAILAITSRLEEQSLLLLQEMDVSIEEEAESVQGFATAQGSQVASGAHITAEDQTREVAERMGLDRSETNASRLALSPVDIENSVKMGLGVPGKTLYPVDIENSIEIQVEKVENSIEIEIEKEYVGLRNRGSALAQKVKGLIPIFEPEVQRRLDVKRGFAIKALFDREHLDGLKGRTGRVNKLRHKVYVMVSDIYFDSAMSIVILANIIIIGLQLDAELLGTDRYFGCDPSVYLFLENIFFFIYAFELLLRIFAQGIRCFESGWVKFDLILVAVSCYSVIAEAYLGGQDELFGPSGLILLKLGRLVRVLRALRLFGQMRILWQLVHGLISSMTTISSFMLFLFVVFYVFACSGVELITKHGGWSAEAQVIVDHKFTTLPVVMLTLMQFLMQDSISSVYEPLVMERQVVLLFFVSFLFIVSIALMNLLTAIIVEGHMDQTRIELEVDKAYRKETQKELLPKMASIFDQLDVDRSGTITKAELFNAPESVQSELNILMKTSDLHALFDSIDHDGSGSVSMDEFFDRMMHVVLSQVPIQDFQIMNKLDRNIEHVRRLQETVNDLCSQNQYFHVEQSKMLQRLYQNTEFHV
jgi:voltage-gated sodium channel